MIDRLNPAGFFLPCFRGFLQGGCSFISFSFFSKCKANETVAMRLG